ncbi:hypothetical protein RM572_07265 [Streptomyces sp. DSM 42041]|uniref:Uncharacterized protein n=1 Tax=Streptomyces hazeniae TaxID=3075538 RepID=A0ABU2NQ46_9ACTN|nr:hypothetical protein [Streptomyces sp. DSM 42041]MDT0378577.1 hypothetical protein [Streptomyces sp. DSM 42041]
MSESTVTGPEPAAPDAAPATVPPTDATPAPTNAPPRPESPPAAGPVAEPSQTDETPAEPSAPARRRRLLRAVARWTAAVAVFGVLGTGVAYGITELERTDVPGLATAPDGRWAYPELKLPALPEGSPRPFAEGNDGEIHHADVRDLLLPAPRGARGGEDLPGIEGTWVSVDTFAQAYVDADRDELKQTLRDTAVRHIAARGWRMPDGTRTTVYLLRFNSAAYPGDFLSTTASGASPYVTVTDGEMATLDDGWPEDVEVPDIEHYTFDESEPRGERHVRQAYLVAGDTVAVIVQSRKGEAAAVPFQQTVILQSQLLG